MVTLALILANKAPLPAAAAPAPAAAAGRCEFVMCRLVCLWLAIHIAPAFHSAALITTSATLVVCAVSLVGQWIAEAKDKLASGATALKIHMCVQ